MQEKQEKNANTFTQVDDFPRLVEQMKSTNIATFLIEKVVDFTALVRKLLAIIHSAVVYWPEPSEG